MTPSEDAASPSPLLSSGFAPRPSPLAPLAVGLLVFSVSLAAAATIAPGWDEGYTWKRIDTLEPWVKRWFQPGVSVKEQLSTATLKEVWRFSREEPDGHGPFYALLSYAGHALTRGFLAPPLSYRIGSVALFAVACAVLFRTLRSHWGSGPAGVAVTLLATQPRIVPEVCFGVVDGPLLSLAMLTYCGFLAALERSTFLRIAAFGVPAGCAMATKLTGWVLLGAYGGFAALCLLRLVSGPPAKRAMKIFIGGLGIAAATCLLLNVGWWPDPLHGVYGFFQSNLTRDKTTWIPNYFMGRTYDFALPWYNTLVWTVVAMPPLTVVLGALGLLAAARWRSPPLVLAALLWAAIMVVRALPQAPGHDGVRQIIIAFAFLAVLGGGAAAGVRSWRARRGMVLLGWIAAAASAFECWAYHPVELSYFSPIVGGLRGAVNDFEPTYFWDALTPDAVAWLNEHTPPDRSLFFSSNPENWKYLYRWRILKAPPFAPDGAAPEPLWYVLQHRTSVLRPADRWLLEKGEPAYQVNKFGVPLVCVYPIEQFRRACEAAK